MSMDQFASHWKDANTAGPCSHSSHLPFPRMRPSYCTENSRNVDSNESSDACKAHRVHPQHFLAKAKQIGHHHNNPRPASRGCPPPLDAPFPVRFAFHGASVNFCDLTSLSTL